MKVLNLYACLGGNRYKWDEVAKEKGIEIEVTAIELDEELAKLYKERFPNDNVVVADAHKYLSENYKNFDFIWSSPPCPSHSRSRFARKETTKAVFITHVEFLTGQLHDIKKITDHAHDFGSLVVVDGIQAAGYIPLDVRRAGVDVYITGSYKWLLAPFGTAIAYISKDLYDTLTPAFVGWRSSENMWDFNAVELKYPQTAMKFEYSTSAYGVKIGLAESIKYLRTIGITNIYNHNMKLTELLIEELREIKNVRIITPEEKGSIITFTILGKDCRKIGGYLTRLNRPIELSIRQSMIRISLHVYNTEEDVMHFINNLKEVLRKV